MKTLLAILFILVAAGGGAVAGFVLKPAPEGADIVAAAAPVDDGGGARAFVKIGRQTIVPVVEEGETKALMLFELALDVPTSDSANVHEMEPRLRDAFLRELFRLSHTGAFMTNFTDDRVIEELRRNLTRAAREQIGPQVREVLILDVMRQEL